MPVDDGPGKPVGINRHSLQTSFELSRAETERPVSYDPSIAGFEMRRVLVTVGSDDQASAIFFSTALKRTLRLPTSAVAVATAPPSL
jgi:hypothetical protein